MVYQTKWFTGHSSSKESLKNRYRELVQMYHPDIVGKDNDEIREINEEYDRLYDIVLRGGVEEFNPPKKDSPKMLIDFHILFFIKNKFAPEYGKFVYSCENRVVYVQKCNRSMRSGFHVCELSTEPVFPGDPDYGVMEVARIIHGKEFEPATFDDIFGMLLSGNVPMSWKSYVPDAWGYATPINITGKWHDRWDFVHIVESENYGTITYRVVSNDVVETFFKMDGMIHRVPIKLKQLGPCKEIEVRHIQDIVTIYRLGYTAQEAFKDVDMGLPSVCRDLGFTHRDIVLDWPLDPVLSRYIRLDVVRVYRHGREMGGHFNSQGLYSAIVKNQIDLEDIDFCQDQFDAWYNQCLDKFERDVKKGRIKLNI